MSADFIYPEYEVLRNYDRCTACRICERQCANNAHKYIPQSGKLVCDESKCVNCQRCVSFCPARALKIVKSGNTYKENNNWSGKIIDELYRQAAAECSFPVWETQKAIRYILIKYC